MDYKNVWVAIIAGGEETTEENVFVQATESFISLGIKPTQIVIITTSDNQTKMARLTSSRIYQIGPDFGYAEAMIKTAELIESYDKKAIIINTQLNQYLTADKDFATIKKAITEAKSNKPTIVGVKANDAAMPMDCGYDILKPDKKAFSADELMAKLSSLKITVCHF